MENQPELDRRMRGNVLVRCGGELDGNQLPKCNKALSFDSNWMNENTWFLPRWKSSWPQPTPHAALSRAPARCAPANTRAHSGARVSLAFIYLLCSYYLSATSQYASGAPIALPRWMRPSSVAMCAPRKRPVAGGGRPGRSCWPSNARRLHNKESRMRFPSNPRARHKETTP
jgi:hypothetical protein